MSYVDDTVALISARLMEIETSLAAVETTILLTRMSVSDGNLNHIPGGELVGDTVVLPALSLADNCITTLYNLVATCRVEIAFAGSPDNLRAAADLIDLKIKSPAQGLSPTLVLGKIPSSLESNYSDGEASEMYEHAIDGRDAAVLGIADQSSPIALALRTLADAIENYYFELLGIIAGGVAAVAGVVVAVVGIQQSVAAAGATGVSGGAATPLLIGTLVQAAAGVLTAIAGAITVILSVANHKNTIGQVKDSIYRSLGGSISSWPKANV